MVVVGCLSLEEEFELSQEEVDGEKEEGKEEPGQDRETLLQDLFVVESDLTDLEHEMIGGQDLLVIRNEFVLVQGVELFAEVVVQVLQTDVLDALGD